jgi:hypothetical protein
MINVDYVRTCSAASPLRAFYKYSPAKNITNTTLLYPAWRVPSLLPADSRSACARVNASRKQAPATPHPLALWFQRQRYSAVSSGIPANIEYRGLRGQTGLGPAKLQFIAAQFVISHNHSVLGKYQYG